MACLIAFFAGVGVGVIGELVWVAVDAAYSQAKRRKDDS
jgi:hypothetical protein